MYVVHTSTRNIVFVPRDTLLVYQQLCKCYFSLTEHWSHSPYSYLDQSAVFTIAIWYFHSFIIHKTFCGTHDINYQLRNSWRARFQSLNVSFELAQFDKVVASVASVGQLIQRAHVIQLLGNVFGSQAGHSGQADNLLGTWLTYNTPNAMFSLMLINDGCVRASHEAIDLHHKLFCCIDRNSRTSLLRSNAPFQVGLRLHNDD